MHEGTNLRAFLRPLQEVLVQATAIAIPAAQHRTWTLGILMFIYHYLYNGIYEGYFKCRFEAVTVLVQRQSERQATWSASLATYAEMPHTPA